MCAALLLPCLLLAIVLWLKLTLLSFTRPEKSRDYNLNEEPSASATDDNEAYGFDA